MTTLQEYLDNKYPTKEDKEKVEDIIIKFDKIFDETPIIFSRRFWGRTLDLSGYPNLKIINIQGDCLAYPLENLNLGKQTKLESFAISKSWLTSLNLSGCDNLNHFSFTCESNPDKILVDFLNTLPNPKNLESLVLWNNNFRPTNIEIFSKFVNLKVLRIGSTKSYVPLSKRNKFFGSFESWKNLTRLETICIEATDVDNGLEYLSSLKLLEETKNYGYSTIECSPHGTDAKCKAIQDQLRPFNYDIEAWQLVHPEKMLIARPELFTNPDSKSN